MALAKEQFERGSGLTARQAKKHLFRIMQSKFATPSEEDSKERLMLRAQSLSNDSAKFDHFFEPKAATICAILAVLTVWLGM